MDEPADYERQRYYDEQNIVDLIDQLEVEFSERFNDILVSKAGVIKILEDYFDRKHAKPYKTQDDFRYGSQWSREELDSIQRNIERSRENEKVLEEKARIDAL